MPNRFRRILAPGVQTMTADQESVQAGVFLQDAGGLRGERLHVLAVFENGKPFTMLVGGHAIQALQHLVAMDKEAALSAMVVRENCAPHRVCVYNSSGVARTEYFEVKQGFGGRLTRRRADDASAGIHFKNLIGLKASFIHGTRRYREAKRFAFDDRAEIAAGPENPAAPVKIASELGEVFGCLGKRHG